MERIGGLGWERLEDKVGEDWSRGAHRFFSRGGQILVVLAPSEVYERGGGCRCIRNFFNLTFNFCKF